MWGIRKMAGMRKPTVLSGTVFFILFLLFVAGSVPAGPVMPNGAWITGVTLEYGMVSSCLLGIQPDQIFYKLTIHLESSEDMVGMPNLLKGKEGEDITFYTKEKLSSDIFGKKVKAHVSYRGDERGGRWWVYEIEIVD